MKLYFTENKIIMLLYYNNIMRARENVPTKGLDLEA